MGLIVVMTVMERIEKREEGVAQEPLLFYQQLLAGAAAGVNYNFVCFPADTIKSRMQTEEVSGQSGRGEGESPFGRVGGCCGGSRG